MTNNSPVAPMRHAELLDHEAVVRLEAAMRAHAYVLDECLFDAKREYEDGAKIAYAVDFHEIYTYAYRFDSRAYDAIAIRYILDNTKRSLILPAGTIFEACVHLGSVLKRFPEFHAKIAEFEKQLLPEACAQLVPFLQSNTETDMSVALQQLGAVALMDKDMLSALKRLWGDVSRIERELLYILDISSKMLGIPEIIDNPTEIRFDDSAYDMAFRTLKDISSQYTHRKRSLFSNAADALNLATIISVRKYIEDKAVRSGKDNNRYDGAYFLYLLTHTPALINPQLWITDEFSSKYRRPRELIRDPFTALYSTFLEQHWPEPKDRIANIIKKKKKVEGCIYFLRRLPEWNDATREGFHIEQWDILASSGTIDDNVKQRLKELRDKIDDPVITDIEELITNAELAESERRSLEGESLFGFDAGYIGRVMLRIQRLRGLISSILGIIDEKALSKQAFDLSKSSTDSFTWLINRVSPAHTAEAGDTECIRHHLTDVRGRELIKVDVIKDMPQDYYMSLWPCLTTLETFVTSLSEKFEHLLKQPKEGYKTNNIDVHIIIYTNGQEIDFQSRLPINAEDIRSQIGPEQQLIAVKVLSNVGDFFLDLIPHRSTGELYCGVTSYYSMVDTIVNLFTETAKRIVLPSVLRPHLSQWLSSFKDWEGILIHE
jgi:hypothetical protein